MCAPSRACLFTSLYTNRHGVWRNGIALPEQALTLATSSDRRATAPITLANGAWVYRSSGAVAPEYRGGFADFWEGCNELELTSHPYEGIIWDGEGQPIQFQRQYRVDFLTSRVVRFLNEKARTPFFLVVSYLETSFSKRLQLLCGAERLCGPLPELRCAGGSEILPRGLGNHSFPITTDASRDR